jgi:hypothetical protein
VRSEERVLFAQLDRTLDADRLTALDAAMQAAEHP